LLDKGWNLLGQNIDVEENGCTFGDVDFVLTSPHGLGFSIDAKNGHDQVRYDRATKTVKFWNPWFGRGYDYPVSRAWFLADWIRDSYDIMAVEPIMCFTDKVPLAFEGNAYGLHMVRIGNLVSLLERINATYAAKASAPVMPVDVEKR